MISRISSVEKKEYTPNLNAGKNRPAFQGLGDVALAAFQACERNPMLNVAVIDLSTAILPRTYIETKESNIYAGMEAFRRESSGLVVNCLLPGFVVMGLSALLQKIPQFNGLKGMPNLWADEESIKVVHKYLEQADGTGSKKLEKALSSFLNDLTGVDGHSRKSFKDFDLSSGVKEIVSAVEPVADKRVKPSKLIQKGYENIAGHTHMTEHLELDGKVLSKNLKGYIDDFVQVYKSAEKSGVKSTSELSKFIQKTTKFINWKSFAGLAFVIPLAISMQPINRWITSKQSGVKGAPIYKDYKEAEHRELTPKEKSALLKQKIVSIGSMLGVMFLSMGKIPGKDAFRQMIQFKGKFPTMDQARLISTATFASRMAASEDKNELREATIRDIATFSSLYFLGDYAAKGVATLIEKLRPDIKLLNTIKELPKDANAFAKFKHWVKDVNLKSSEEVVTKAAKNMRSVCQLGSQAFSLLALGLFIPLYNRTQTNKKREEELKKLAESVNSTDGFLKTQIKNSSPAFKSFFSLQ